MLLIVILLKEGEIDTTHPPIKKGMIATPKARDLTQGEGLLP